MPVVSAAGAHLAQGGERVDPRAVAVGAEHEVDCVPPDEGRLGNGDGDVAVEHGSGCRLAGGLPTHGAHAGAAKIRSSGAGDRTVLPGDLDPRIVFDFDALR